MKKQSKKIIVIVLDSLGIGSLPDAHEYGDQGAATLQNIIKASGNFELPHLRSLGLGLIIGQQEDSSLCRKGSSYGKMASTSKGKDTTVGHWELMGLSLEQAMSTFPKGFPKVMIDKLMAETGHSFIGNYPASGTEIIKDLGEEHIKDKKLILYTSSDSVLQIAAHEQVIPLSELYRVCQIARKICDEYQISRVIARPFEGQTGEFKRTKNRKDFSILPPKPTALNYLKSHSINTVGIGKIDDIFAGSGLNTKIHSKGNLACIQSTLEEMAKPESAFIFTNLVDFDMLYGHRRDPLGYYQCLQEFDHYLPQIISKMKNDDLLIITADHGNDPTYKGTDHTREYVPLLVFSTANKNNICGLDLGLRKSFADVGSTVLDFFEVKEHAITGESFLKFIIPR